MDVCAACARRGRLLARAGGATIASQPVRLPPRPALLAGRVELLAELDARLAGGEGAGPAVAALYGLGGAGKTSVAVEYAHQHLDEVGVAWQFACEDPAVLAAGFAELAAQLGAREVVDARDEPRGRSASCMFIHRLAWSERPRLPRLAAADALRWLLHRAQPPLRPRWPRARAGLCVPSQVWIDRVA
jgi:hypothetical protein